MAKGDPGGLYVPETIGVDTPLDQLVAWVLRENQRISDALSFPQGVEFVNVAPAKPRDGMLVGADGTNWNPGAGKGVYVYYATSWHFLG